MNERKKKIKNINISTCKMKKYAKYNKKIDAKSIAIHFLKKNADMIHNIYVIYIRQNILPFHFVNHLNCLIVWIFFMFHNKSV